MVHMLRCGKALLVPATNLPGGTFASLDQLLFWKDNVRTREVEVGIPLEEGTWAILGEGFYLHLPHPPKVFLYATPASPNMTDSLKPQPHPLGPRYERLCCGSYETSAF